MYSLDCVVLIILFPRTVAHRISFTFTIVAVKHKQHRLHYLADFISNISLALTNLSRSYKYIFSSVMLIVPKTSSHVGKTTVKQTIDSVLCLLCLHIY